MKVKIKILKTGKIKEMKPKFADVFIKSTLAELYVEPEQKKAGRPKKEKPAGSAAPEIDTSKQEYMTRDLKSV